ncbi:MAG: hypothetical protein EOO20_20820 [Chryseobacterium sp.]|nr:MAG: hypothetical protein EOO20_20820 [Chryseobacterium sp.]
MTVNEHRQVIAVVPGSQAASAHVACGDVVLAVAGVDMTSLGYDDVLAAIRQSERPVTITFQRVQTAAAPSVKVAQAAAKAGALMKGILSAGVHVIAAVDRSIDRAFDDSAKVCAHAARGLGGGVCAACRQRECCYPAPFPAACARICSKLRRFKKNER